ncbi:hypothetical protein PMAYCL1PPCAC_17143, partial [Pristionchus mayeri]
MFTHRICCCSATTVLLVTQIVACILVFAACCTLRPAYMLPIIIIQVGQKNMILNKCTLQINEANKISDIDWKLSVTGSSSTLSPCSFRSSSSTATPAATKYS